ncbi:YmfQ family protein [Niameybacter massiliensis]|uniref:YmfQ family protein n=1 Tax=Holtiella tumoricola TaxID=3018743 RepID=A0AA42DJI8_9FIRM|nr:YmfQ family protein [Holtiella tumoricola]MDA3730079.1 YmfQ family protein [Holtiella tumoricola]
MGYGQNLYGESSYGSSQESTHDEIIEVDLMKYLPTYWHEIEQMKVLQEILGMNLAEVIAFKQDLFNQMFIETATWGLSRWEKILGLPTEIEKNYEFRRERIKSKIRGSGTTTKQMIVNLASAFSNGEVEVIEYPNEYRFVVKFVGIKGVPANMKDLTSAIEEVKPAHLAFTFEYTYNYWNNLKAYTWSALSIHTWDKVKVI